MSRKKTHKTKAEQKHLDRAAALGCIAVLTRDGGGHVGFVVGRAPNGDVMLLGGNQSDQVCMRAFAPSRVTGYRWPAGVPDVPQGISEISGQTSTSEA
ncbi:hypothetical protein [Enterobacter asburiae]|uniref:hypothetical protein n=1 Tax=Enterobacter asburiae TaxID=61645 RepID=UPI003F5416C4